LGNKPVLAVPDDEPPEIALNKLLSAEAVAAAPLAVMVKVPLIVQSPWTYSNNALHRLLVVKVIPELIVKSV
jgi:hypothetical protein